MCFLVQIYLSIYYIYICICVFCFSGKVPINGTLDIIDHGEKTKKHTYESMLLESS